MLVSVYIRKSDEDRWRKLPKKTEAIHKMLHNTNTNTNTIGVKETVPANTIMKTKDDAKETVKPIDKRPPFTGYIPPGKNRKDYAE